MKLGKILGITCLISGTAALGAWIYNEARWEKMNREFWQEQIDKSKAFKDAIHLDGQVKKTYFETTQIMRDSVTNINMADTFKSTVKIIK